jgi:hypothetical protein
MTTVVTQALNFKLKISKPIKQSDGKSVLGTVLE